jgi:hypothetical protein
MKKLKEIPLLNNFVFFSLLCFVHTPPPWLLMTLVEKSCVSRFDTKNSREIAGDILTLH